VTYYWEEVDVTDVVVIGAGIVGAACARSLARRGLSVIVVDRGQAMSATSASCEGNLLVSDKGPGAELDLALVAIERWAETVDELTDELGASLPPLEFERKGGLVVAVTDEGSEPLQAFADTQRAVGVDARVLAPDQARELEPFLTQATTAVIHYPQDAQIQPVAAGEALLASARRAGAEVRTGVEVTGPMMADGRLVGVRTTAGDIPAGAVVVAAGPWSGVVSELLGAAVPVKPRRGMVLVTTRMPHRIFHKVYDGDYFGATQSKDASLQTSSVVESTAAGTVLIGSSREQVGFDGRLRVEVLRELAAKAVTLFPFLQDAPVMRTYGGFRPYLDDHLPLIGADERLPGLWHASGHEGAGIGLSVATADLIAAQMLGGSPPVDPTPFRPSVDRLDRLGALTPEVTR
jgi:glycine/D-amino acid oxidase-like deaminating enzyme